MELTIVNAQKLHLPQLEHLIRQQLVLEILGRRADTSSGEALRNE